ncbi:MAG: phage tail protein [Rouxiella aceris]|uniref:phage tail protein n=1 Tax=Rouxiella aceris TaxID=2703884 RepID=UPI002848386E|nr:phage tail protein [Rouxiella aceris]MDR3434641.1 phage tail protein [Rouxiella aceris]
MTTKYFALLTNQGAAKLANAAALGTKLQITHMSVGDGGGTLPTPTGTQTALIGEKRRALLNALSVDAANSSQIIAEQIIPENEGGFWIREIGLYDSDNTLIAVANCPETYKPLLAEGSGRTQTVRMILIVNSTDAVTLKIDPSVVLATRQYVDNAVIEVKAYADDLMKKHIAAKNPHNQYLQVANALKEIKDTNLVAGTLENLGLGAIALAGVTGGLIASSGYAELPVMIAGERKSLYIQWGGFSGTTGSIATSGIFESPGISVTWPVAFPNAALQVITGGSSDVGGAGQQEMAWSLGKTRTYGNFGFQCRTANAAMTGSYIAIGY